MAVLFAAGLWLGQPAAADTTPPSRAVSSEFVEGVVKLWDPAAARGLAYEARLYRVLHNPGAKRNVAVFRYRLPNDEERTLAIDSAPFTEGGGKASGEGHSAERLDHILERWGIDPDWVIDIYSELEPCAQPGHFCRNLLVKRFKKLQNLNWTYPYPFAQSNDEQEKAQAKRIRTKSMKKLRKAVGKLRKAATLPGGLGSAKGKQPFGKGRNRLSVLTPDFIPELPSGGAGCASASPVCPGPGGIDFSTLQLRYVADTGSARRPGLRYAFHGAATMTPSDPAIGLRAAGQSSDALFAWLALPRRSFWVNLNPSEPNRIIDPELGRTDAGRVLLEADLQLKKLTIGLVNPDTPLGDRYWDELERLYGERAPEACASARVWIVPTPAMVRDTGDELYILDAPLTVKTESQLVANPDTHVASCPQDDPALEARKEELLRRLILPQVVQAVNQAPEFAALRRVYLSRVAAEWLRRRSARHRTAVSPIVDSGRIDRWVAETPWDPRSVFDQYVESLRDGEWTAKRTVQVGDRVYVRTLIGGGVDFSRAPRHNVTRRVFRSRWPGLAERVRRSRQAPVVGRDDGWLTSGGRPAALRGVRLGIRTAHHRLWTGRRVTYRLRVANPTDRVLRDVRVCDRLPSQLDYVGSSRRPRLHVGSHCWRVRQIAAGDSKTIRVTARVLPGSHGRVANEATATVRDGGTAARRTVTVSGAGRGRPGGVTG